MGKRILFLYLTKHSGHYAAATAVEQALHQLEPSIETRMLDSFSHTNPLLSKVTLKAYLAMLKAAPEIWEYMYDNPEFQTRTRVIRDLLNRGNSRKLQKYFDQFQPDAVICTQAFACGVLASWKQARQRRTPVLVGVLTDYVAHRYWAHDMVDLYITPTEETRNTLVRQGVPAERVQVTGIPVASQFAAPVDKLAVQNALGLRTDLPKVLVMGGSLGLGPVKSVIRKLDKLPQPFDIIAVTGKNGELKQQLSRKGHKLRHPLKILGFAENVHELMEVADFGVTKPGGMTTAEALVKKMAMIIINPIPGQEQKNTDYLLANQVAVRAEDANQVAEFAADFLRNPQKVDQMRAAAATLGRPHAATEAAREILRVMNRASVLSDAAAVAR